MKTPTTQHTTEAYAASVVDEILLDLLSEDLELSEASDPLPPAPGLPRHEALTVRPRGLS